MFKTKVKIIIGYLKTFWFLWIFTGLLNIIAFLTVYLKIDPNNQAVALKYSVLSGVEWYGKGYNIYFLPATALAASIINFLLYLQVKRHGNFLNFLTVFASLAVQLIILLSILLLIRVN